MVNGNGQPGISQKVDTCVEELSAIRGAQDERSRIEDRRFRFQTIMIAALTLATSVFAILLTIHFSHTGELKFPSMQTSGPVVAYKAESAGGGFK